MTAQFDVRQKQIYRNAKQRRIEKKILLPTMFSVYGTYYLCKCSFPLLVNWNDMHLMKFIHKHATN